MQHSHHHLPNHVAFETRTNSAQHCAKAKHCVHGDKPDKLQKSWVFRAGTWNIDSLSGEVVKVLSDRAVDVACVHEMRWMSSVVGFWLLWSKGTSWFGVDIKRN